jgi:hypothetical protein
MPTFRLPRQTFHDGEARLVSSSFAFALAEASPSHWHTSALTVMPSRRKKKR